MEKIAEQATHFVLDFVTAGIIVFVGYLLVRFVLRNSQNEN